jgi:hypothetical protein
MGLQMYARENDGWYPTLLPPAEAPAAQSAPTTRSHARADGGSHGIAYLGRLGADRTQATSPAGGGHPLRAAFALISQGTCTPKQFICLSSRDSEDEGSVLIDGLQRPGRAGVNWFDFKGYPFVSYGYQLPYGPHALPRIGAAAGLAIMADKGPYFQAGTADPVSGVVPDTLVGAPGSVVAPPRGMAPGTSLDWKMYVRKVGDWSAYNSRNHESAGQNVLFNDAHVDFCKIPMVGIAHDNVYTIQRAGAPELEAKFGVLPADFRGPVNDEDSVIVP